MNNDPQLRELLRDSLPDAPAHHRFGAEVWQRIEARSAAAPEGAWSRVLALFTRPAFAAVALLLSAGGAAGVASLHAADVNAKALTTLAERHVAKLDPFARMMATR